MPGLRILSIASAFAIGIAAADGLSPAICITCALGVILFAWRFVRHMRATLIILAAVFALGAARYAISCRIDANDIVHYANRVSSFEGVIASDPDMRPYGLRAVLNVTRVKTHSDWHSATGSVMLNLYDCNKISIRYGDKVHISTYAYIPSEPTNPGEFSWKGYLARQGIYTCASVRNAHNIRIIKRNVGNPLISTACAVKHCISRSIAQIHPKREASVITGMALGTYAYLPRSTFSDFSRTGTLHILAASGFNCAVVLFAAVFILSLSRMPKKWHWIGCMIFVLFYVLIVGAKASLIRAAIMTTLMLLATPLKRVPSARSILFTTGLIALMINPSDLFDVGFQLSYLAVWALIEVSPVISAFVKKYEVSSAGAKHPLLAGIWAKYVALPTVATVAISLVTWPVTAYYFNYISLTSLPANIGVAAAAPIILCEGLLSVAAVHMGTAGMLIGDLGTLLTRAMLSVINALGSLRYSAISIQSPGPMAIAGYYLILGSVLYYVRSVLEDK